jgi:DNA-binding transcriptional ArsR family regulator
VGRPRTAPDEPGRERQFRALAHPLRLQLLSLLTGAALSAAEAGRELGITQANASYHLRVLHDAGLLDIAEEVMVRGGSARRYRPRAEDEHAITPVGVQDHLLLAAATSTELQRRTEHRDVTIPGSFADAELWVDPDVWAQVRADVSAAMGLLHEAATLPRSRGTVRVSATVSLFQMTTAE